MDYFELMQDISDPNILKRLLKDENRRNAPVPKKYNHPFFDDATLRYVNGKCEATLAAMKNVDDIVVQLLRKEGKL